MTDEIDFDDTALIWQEEGWVRERVERLSQEEVGEWWTHPTDEEGQRYRVRFVPQDPDVV